MVSVARPVVFLAKDSFGPREGILLFSICVALPCVSVCFFSFGSSVSQLYANTSARTRVQGNGK